MMGFIFGLIAGWLLSGRHPEENTSERLYEHEQAKTLVDIVKVSSELEKSASSAETRKIQLEVLKRMFDRIDSSAFHSSEGKELYQKMRKHFLENGLE